MARREDALGVTGADTMIGAGVVVQGNLVSEGDMVVDGEVNGHIRTVGNLTIGVNAIVHGNVAGDNITVAGALNGSVSADSEASIRETGKVIGDIRCGSLSVGSGAIFQGRVLMRSGQTLNLEGVEGQGA